MTITAIAPCRISLFGGGTDVDPFASQFGGEVLSLAIDVYHHALLTPRQDNKVVLRALDDIRTLDNFKTKLKYGEDKKFDLLRAIINYFRPKIKTGFDLDVKLLAPAATGLGSSASAAVTVIAVLNEWLKTKLSREAIGLLAGNLEIEELGWPGGKQDGIAAAVGGVNRIYFGPGKIIKVEPIIFEKKLIQEFWQHSLMFNIGGERHSGDQQKHLIQGMSQAKKLAALKKIKAAVPQAIKLWQLRHWQGLGELMNIAWTNKKTTNPSATNARIDHFYSIALKAGAYGGKLLGSGGAGHLFFLVDKFKAAKVATVMTQAGANFVSYELDSTGVKVSHG